MLKMIGGTLVGGVKYSDLLTPMKTKTHPPQTVMLQIMTKAMTRTTLNIK